MRYGLAMILMCAAAMPAAAAPPTPSLKSLAASQADSLVQTAKTSRAHAHRQSRRDNGIHPLVGSGDY